MSLGQPVVAGQPSHDGNGFGGGEGEVVEMAPMTLGGAIGRDAIGALALAEELAGVRVETLADGFKLLGFHRTRQSQQFGPAAPPMAHHALAFGVIVAVLQMAGRIALRIGHGPDGQHNPVLLQTVSQFMSQYWSRFFPVHVHSRAFSVT